MSLASGFSFRLRPANGDLRITRFSRAAGFGEFLDSLFVVANGNKSVREAGGALCAVLAAGRNIDWRKFGRKSVNARILDNEVSAPVTVEAALPQLPDQAHSFLQHFLTYCGPRPLAAHDMFVQVF